MEVTRAVSGNQRTTANIAGNPAAREVRRSNPLRIAFTTCVAGPFSGTDFCLIFAPQEGCDGLEILPSSTHPICLMSADDGHFQPDSVRPKTRRLNEFFDPLERTSRSAASRKRTQVRLPRRKVTKSQHLVYFA
jgi:hypothetical protein